MTWGESVVSLSCSPGAIVVRFAHLARALHDAYRAESKRRGGAALQLHPDVETADSQCRRRRGPGQHRAQQDRGKDDP